MSRDNSIKERPDAFEECERAEVGEFLGVEEDPAADGAGVEFEVALAVVREADEVSAAARAVERFV